MIQFVTVAPSRRTYSHFDFFQAQAESSPAPNRRARKESDYWFYKTMKAFNHSTIVLQIFFPSSTRRIFVCPALVHKKRTSRLYGIGYNTSGWRIVAVWTLQRIYRAWAEDRKRNRSDNGKSLKKATGQKKEIAMKIILKFVRLFCGGFE